MSTPPLPLGTRVALDRDTTTPSADVVVGGSPGRIFRLNGRARKAFSELRAGTVTTADAAGLGRRLSDAGAVHPVPEPVGADRAAAEVTVVVPVRDRAGELTTCLRLLAFPGRVVVVDDGSADPSAVERAAGRHGAEVIRRPVNGGPAAARNTGLAQVTTPFVAFLDSDCLPEPGWIAALLGHFDDPLVVAAAPRIVAPDGPAATFAERFALARPVLDLGDRPARVKPMTLVSYVPTAALVMRTAAAGFDADLRYGEDVDLVWRLIEAGHRVRYDPRATVAHVEPTTWRALLGRRFAYGTSAAALEDRHPGQVAPLVLVAAPAAVVAAGLARRPVLAAAAFAAGYAEVAVALRRQGLPVRGVARPLAEGVRETFLGSGHWISQFALPVAAASVLLPGRRATRALTLAAWIAAGPTRAWLRRRPAIGAGPYVLGVLADDAAYGAGVWAGSRRRGHLRAVRPRWRLHLVAPGTVRRGGPPPATG